MNKTIKMDNNTALSGGRLSEENCQLFLKLYQNFLIFAAQKLRLLVDVKGRNDFLKLPMEEKAKIRDVAIKHIFTVNEFARSNPCSFMKSNLELVSSWKNCIHKNFFVVKYTKDGAIFLEEDDKDPKAYLVLALGNSFEEILLLPPPIRVKAVLLPFKDRIIYDGILRRDNIIMGPGIARSIRAECDESIVKHGLVKSLPSMGSGKFSDKDALIWYLRTAESRVQHEEKIQDILLKNKDLLPTYFREIGRANSRQLKKQLKDVGVTRGWFAAAGDAIVASSKTKEELEKLVEHIIPVHGKESVYIFELK